MITPTPQQILDLELPDNDSGETTVRGYLVRLLANVWDEDEGFSGKRPFGNSGWKSDFWAAFIAAGWVEGTLDEDEYVEDVDRGAVDALVRSAIAELARPSAIPAAPVNEARLHALNLATALHKDAFRIREAENANPGDAVLRDAARFAEFIDTGTLTDAPVSGIQESETAR